MIVPPGYLVLSYATTFRNSKNPKIPSFFGGQFALALKQLLGIYVYFDQILVSQNNKKYTSTVQFFNLVNISPGAMPYITFTLYILYKKFFG